MLVFDRTGRSSARIGSRGRSAGQLLAPSRGRGLPGGTVYVADEGNGRIVRFSTAGTHLGSFGQFRSLRGVAVVAGRLARVRRRRGAQPDHGLHRLRRRPGRVRPTGSKLGQLRSPSGIATDAAGNVWVADRGNDRVQAVHAPTARR